MASRICVTFDGNSGLRPCHCRRFLYCAQQDVKMHVIVWKPNGTQSWRLLSFLLLRFSLSPLPYPMFVPFLYFALIHPHSSLLAVDNWSVVDDLMSRRPAYSSFVLFSLYFSPLISCVAVCSFTVVHLVKKNCLNFHSASVNHSSCRKMKSQTLGTHGKRQERFPKSHACLFLSLLRQVQASSDKSEVHADRSRCTCKKRTGSACYLNCSCPKHYVYFVCGWNALHFWLL